MERNLPAFAFGLAFVMMAAADPASAQSQEECADNIVKAEQAGILKGARFNGGALQIVVDHQTWDSVPFSTKLGIVETYNCAVAGPGKVLQSVEILSDRTNRVLGRHNGIRLTIE